jgi:hypothetical protein
VNSNKETIPREKSEGPQKKDYPIRYTALYATVLVPNLELALRNHPASRGEDSIFKNIRITTQ